MKYSLLFILCFLSLSVRSQSVHVDTLGFAIELTGNADALDNQTLALDTLNDLLSIIRGNAIDLSKYLDNTDNQKVNYLALSPTNILSVGVEDGDTITVDLSGLNLTGLAPQNLTLQNDSILITGGAGVDISAYIDTNTDEQDLSKSVTGTDVTINITNGTGVTFSVADNDNDATNELYDDAPILDSIIMIKDSLANHRTDLSSIYTSLATKLTTPTGGSTNYVLAKDGSGNPYWKADAVTGDPDGYVSNITLSGNVLTVTGEANAIDTTITFSGWDTNSSDDLTTATTFDGDVTGTYNSTVVGNDSHSHTKTTLPQFTLEGLNFYNATSANIDLSCSGCSWTTPTSSQIALSVPATSTNLTTGVAPSGTYGNDAAWIYSNTGTDIALKGSSTIGKTPVKFIVEGTNTLGAGVTESDPNVASHIKSILQTDINSWNAAAGYGNHATQGYLTAEVDGSTTNEIQTLSLSGNTLSLSNGGGSADLSPYTTFDIDALGATTSIATTDYIALSNGGTEKKILRSNLPFVSSISATGLDFTLGTNNAMTANFNFSELSTTGTPATVDQIMIYDVSENAYKKFTWLYLMDYIESNDDVNDADYSPTNEIQTLSFNSGTGDLTISGGNTIQLNSFSPRSQEEVQDFVGSMLDGNTETGIAVTYDDANNKINFVAADASASNEIQTISLSGNTLSLSNGGGTVNLAPYAVGEVNVQSDWSVTDVNSDAYIVNKPSIPTVPTVVSAFTNDAGYIITEADGSTSNELQTLSSPNYNLDGYSSIPITLSNGGGTITLATGGVNSPISFASYANNVIQIRSNAEQNVNADWSATSGDALILNKPTIPTQTSQLTNNSGFLTSEVDGSITNEIQDLSLSGNTLSLSGDASTVSLAAYANVNADWNATSGAGQILNKPSLAPANAEQNVQSDWNEASSGSDAFIKNKPTIPTQTSQLTNNSGFLTSEVDGSVTNEIQDLSLSGTTLSLSGDATPVSLAAFLTSEVDGSVTNEIQNLSLGAKTGTVQPINISGGTGVSIDVADNDNSSTNEIQDLSLSGNTLSLSGDATTVSLAAFANVNADWNATSGAGQILNKPSLAPANAEQNVQSDWNEANSGSDAFIKNKPTIPTQTSQLTNNSGFLTAEVDGSTTNELQTLQGVFSKSITDNVLTADGNGQIILSKVRAISLGTIEDIYMANGVIEATIIKVNPTAEPACNSTKKGQIFFNTADNHFYGCNGTTWKQLDN